MDLRKEREDAVKDEGKTGRKGESVLTPRKKVFHASYEDPETGAIHEVGLVSKVLDGDEMQEVYRLAPRLARVPLNQLSPDAQLYFKALARVMVQFRNIPDWLERYMQEDTDILLTLLGMAEGHSSAFFRRDGGAGEATPESARFVVAPAEPSAATEE